MANEVRILITASGAEQASRLLKTVADSGAQLGSVMMSGSRQAAAGVDTLKGSLGEVPPTLRAIAGPLGTAASGMQALGLESGLLTRALTLLKNPLTIVGVTLLATGAALAKATADFAANAAEVKRFQAVSGLAAEAADNFADTMQLLGAEASTVQTALFKLGGEIDAGGKALDRLGISIFKAGGEMKAPAELFLEARDGISAMGSASQRSAALMELFGRSGRELAPIFAMSAEKVALLREQAEALSPWSEAWQQRAAEMKVATSALGMAFEGIAVRIGAVVAPFVTLTQTMALFLATQAGRFMDWVAGLAERLVRAVPLLESLAKWIGFLNDVKPPEGGPTAAPAEIAAAMQKGRVDATLAQAEQTAQLIKAMNDRLVTEGRMTERQALEDELAWLNERTAAWQRWFQEMSAIRGKDQFGQEQQALELRFNAALAQIATQREGLLGRLAQNAQATADAMATASKRFREGFIPPDASRDVLEVVAFFEPLIKQVERLGGDTGVLVALRQAMINQVKPAQDWADAMGLSDAAAKKLEEDLAKATPTTTTFAEEITQALNELRTQAGALGGAFDENAARMQIAQRVLAEEAKKGFGIVSERARAAAAELKAAQLDQTMATLETSLQAVGTQAAILGGDFDATAARVAVLQSAFASLIAQSRGELTPEIERVGERLRAALQQQKLEEAWTDIFGSVSGAFEKLATGIIQGTKDIGAAFRDLGQSIVVEFVNRIIKQALDPLVTAAARAVAALLSPSGAATAAGVVGSATAAAGQVTGGTGGSAIGTGFSAVQTASSLASAYPGLAALSSNFSAGGISGVLFGVAPGTPVLATGGMIVEGAGSAGLIGSGGALSSVAAPLAAITTMFNLAMGIQALVNGNTAVGVGTLGGTAVGAVAGAIIGSVVPGIGTVIGALVGSALGGSLGGFFGGLFGSKPKPREVLRAGFAFPGFTSVGELGPGLSFQGFGISALSLAREGGGDFPGAAEVQKRVADNIQENVNRWAELLAAIPDEILAGYEDALQTGNKHIEDAMREMIFQQRGPDVLDEFWEKAASVTKRLFRDSYVQILENGLGQALDDIGAGTEDVRKNLKDAADGVRRAAEGSVEEWRAAMEVLKDSVEQVQAVLDLNQMVTDLGKEIARSGPGARALLQQDAIDAITKGLDEAGEIITKSMQNLVERLADPEGVDSREVLARAQAIADAIRARYKLELDLIAQIQTRIMDLLTTFGAAIVETRTKVATFQLGRGDAGPIQALIGQLEDLARSAQSAAERIFYASQALNVITAATEPAVRGGLVTSPADLVSGIRTTAMPALEALYAEARRLADTNPEQAIAAYQQLAERVQALGQAAADGVRQWAEQAKAAAQAAAEQQIAAIQQAAQAQIAAVEANRQAQLDSLNEQRTALQKQLELSRQWAGIADSIRSQLLDLRLGTSAPPDAIGQLNLARSEFASALASFRAGGGPESASLVSEMVTRVLGAGQNVFTRPSNEWASLFAEVTAALEEVGAAAAARVTPEEQIIAQLEALDTQAKAIEAAAQEQIRAIQAGADVQVAAIQQGLAATITAIDDAANAQLDIIANEVVAALNQITTEQQGLLGQLLAEQHAQLEAITGGMKAEYYIAERQKAAVEELQRLRATIVAYVKGEEIPTYDVGSWNVPRTEMALVHQGEMIVPAPEAEGIRRGGRLGGGGAPTLVVEKGAIVITGVSDPEAAADLAVKKLEDSVRRGRMRYMIRSGQ